MYHTRKEIIKNQNKFRDEIIDYLRKEFKAMKKEISSIETQDKEIRNEKNKLTDKTNKIKIMSEIEKLFISEKNIYPNYYAWWEEETSEVIKNKYIDK